MAGKLKACGGADVAWQSYKSARHRKELDVAHERLGTYLKVCRDDHDESSPMILVDCDQYGLLRPSLAFDLPGEGWLLTHHPTGLLAAIEDYLRSDSLTADDYLTATTVLAKLAGRWENYVDLQKSTLTLAVLSTFEKLSDEVQSKTGDITVSLLSALRCCVAFLHGVLDPRRHWQRAFVRLRSQSDPGLVSVAAAPASFIGMFVQCFSRHWKVAEMHSDLHKNLQLDIMHMLGASLSSCKDNVCVAANQDVCLLLLTLLDPREKCTSLQALAIKVFVKLVHSLHNTVPAEVQTSVDCGVMLVGFLNILSPRYHEDHPIPPCLQLVVLMLDAIPGLMRPPRNAPAMKQLFMDVGCFEKVYEVLDTIKPQVQAGSSDGSMLVCAVFRSFRAVMEQSPAAREGFEARVSHPKLAQVVSAITLPTTDILQQALDMVVEGSYKFGDGSHSIHNTAAVAMLVQWLLSLPAELQSWLADRLYDLCSCGAHNKQSCCLARLLCVVIDVLLASQNEGSRFSEEVEDNLVSLVEVLGAHSIRASELKCLIGALKPTKSGFLPTYYYRLMKSVSVMAHRAEGDGAAPLYYFDLRTIGSSISIPELKHFPSGSSFSFYTWVCLDYPRVKGKATYSDTDGFDSFSPQTRRRILYSFYTAAGTGFEAFFTADLSLVVATVTRKEFITTSLKGLKPSPHTWHSVCVVYHVPRKPWGKCEVSIYIDGVQKRSTAIKAPNFSDNFTSCCIGLAPGRGGGRLQHPVASASLDVEVSLDDSCSSCSVSDCDAEWGQVTNLRGLISSLCIFTEDLSPAAIKLLHSKGPNDLSLFQPKSLQTRELANKLYIYYHAKACKNSACVDLSPLHVSDQSLWGQLSGQHYVTWDVKAMLNSLGGVELLFPILEQVDYDIQVRESGCASEPVSSPGHLDQGKPVNCWLYRESEAVATFFKLVLSMLEGSPSNQQAFFLSEGPATIGALLQRVSPSKITINAFSILQELVEYFSGMSEQRCYLYRYLLFDFRIWSRTSYAVRCAHTEYISAVIKHSMPECRREFGVQFLLDVIRVFDSHSQPPSSDDSIPPLTPEQLHTIRTSILMDIQLYVLNDIHWDELEAIVSFLVGTRDPSLQEEVLRLLLDLLTSCPSQYAVGDLLWDKGLPLLVLIHAQSMSVRLLTIKIMSQLCLQHSYNEFGPIYTALHNGSLAAVIGQMTQHELSSSVILALLELCVAKDKSNYTDFICNLNVYMSVLQLLRCAPLMVRHTICQQVISMLHLTPHHVVDIANSPGWESLFLWLLTPFDPQVPSHSPSLSPSKPSLKAFLAQNKDSADKSLPEDGEEGVQPRKRTTAFVDAKSKENKSLTHTHLVSGLVKKRRSLTYSSSWKNAEQEESSEVSMTLNSVTETIGYILWHSVDYDTGNPPWKVWGKFFAALDTFSSFHTLTLPAHTVKQRLFLLLINAVTLDSKKHNISRTAMLDVMLQLSQLFEDFALCSYPHLESSQEDDEELDVLLLKLAHNFIPDLDLSHCSLELLERYIEMLNSLQLIGAAQPSGLELEILQSAIRLLLGCVASPERDMCVAGSVNLQPIVMGLPKADVHFVLSNLWRLLADESVSVRGPYVTAVIRGILVQHSELNCSLPSLPDLSSQTFPADFQHYCTTQEWKEFAEDTLKTKEAQYSTVLLPWLHTLAQQRAQCRQSSQLSEQRRREIIIQDQKNYHDGILSKFFDLQELEETRQNSVDSQQRNELSVTLHKWRATRRFFTGERGAWSSSYGEREPYLWKLDRAENFSRMRLKLASNYNFDTHSQASQLRDMGCVTETQPTTDTSVLAKVSRRTSTASILEEEDLQLEQLWATDSTQREEAEDVSVKEKVLKTVSCDLISLMERTHGRLEITSRNIYFFSEQQDKKETQTWYSTDFKVPLAQLREIHSRRYNMSRTALEIFLVDQTNYFLNFTSKKTVQKVYGAVLSLRPANLNRVGIRKPARLLQASGLTQKWVRREITNFDYLMQLNTISGRTYNDLNQYPIFPWVLSDYTSAELDLCNPDVYRDLSKPVGIQNSKLVDNVITRYEEFEDPTIGKFHYGSHYSNAAGVMHYLIRVEPFTTLHIELQSGRFDYADRQFFSIPSTWSVIFNTGSDVKELIPEFFYLPEMLKNLNGFDLGKLQSGEILDDVILPNWASSPEDFIAKHRQALESEYVSAHLHEWIDLIFGYKQTGPEAVKALNLFNFYTYEENVNLESIQNPKERRQIESIINNFGQTPTQLFTEAHPQRLTHEGAQKSHAKGFTFIGRRSLVHLFDHLSELKAHFVDISSDGDAVVFVGTPSIQTRALLVSGNPEQLVTVTNTGLLNIHGWLPFSSSRNRQFYFQFDPNAHFDRSRWLYMGGPFSQDLTISSRLFVVSPNNKLLVSAGHWDNSFRVYSIERSKLIARIAHHNDIVTCMALDKAGSGEHLITGSRDTTCAIWKFGANELFDHPLQTLYGHDSEILCVAISTELDIAASGAKDGTCLVHTVRHGRYVHTLTPQKGCKGCEVTHLAISGYGYIVVYTEDASSRVKAVHTRAPCLHLYSVNGNLIEQKELAECLNAVAIVDRYLITGNVRGFLTFRDLFSLRQQNSLNLSEPIRCVSVVLDYHTKVCTHILVGLETGRLIIVSPRDLL